MIGIPRRLTHFQTCFLVIETLGVLIAALLLLRIVNDDVYITLRYADNLAHGRGFVYTPGEHVFGLTTVLLPLLQTIFGWLCGGNVLLGNYLFQYLLLAGCVALAAAYFRHAAFLAALIPLLFFNAQTVGYLGNEMVLLLFFSLAALYCLEAGRDRLMALCLSLMYLARFDAIVFGAILSVWWCWRRRPRPAQVAVHLAIWASLPIVWHIFSLSYYGAFLSNSVTSKILGSEGVKSFPRMLWERHIPENLLGAYIPVGFVTVAGFIYSWRRTGIYLVWLCGFTLLYSIIQAPGITPWYFHTFTFAIILGFSAGAALAARRLLGRNPRGVLVLATAAGCLLAASHLDYSWEANRYRLYKSVAKQISAVTPTDAVVEMNEIGILGYYLSPRPVLDHHFLVIPQGQGPGRFSSIEKLRERLRPAWILLNPYRELTPKEIADYRGYKLRGAGRTPDQSTRLYILQRQP